jgi:hypothetical protein
VLTLSDYLKSGLLKGPHGVLLVDAWNPGHRYTATSTSRTSAPQNRSFNAAKYS